MQTELLVSQHGPWLEGAAMRIHIADILLQRMKLTQGPGYSSLHPMTPPPTVSCFPRSEDSRDTQADRSMFLGDMGALHSPVGQALLKDPVNPSLNWGWLVIGRLP